MIVISGTVVSTSKLTEIISKFPARSETLAFKVYSPFVNASKAAFGIVTTTPLTPLVVDIDPV